MSSDYWRHFQAIIQASELQYRHKDRDALMRCQNGCNHACRPRDMDAHPIDEWQTQTRKSINQSIMQQCGLFVKQSRRNMEAKEREGSHTTLVMHNWAPTDKQKGAKGKPRMRGREPSRQLLERLRFLRDQIDGAKIVCRLVL